MATDQSDVGYSSMEAFLLDDFQFRQVDSDG